MPKTSLSAAVCSLLLITGVPNAWAAADPMKIATMLTAAANATGDFKLAYDKVSAKGEDITLTGIKVSFGTDNTITFPSLVITSAAERPGGGFTAKHMAFDAGSAHASEGDAKWATAAFDDVIVPSAQEIDGHAKVRPFGKMTLGNLSFAETPKGAPVTAANLTIDVGPVSDAAPTTVKINATGVKMPVAFINNPIGTAMISRMGYTEFNATVAVDSVYDTAKNAITINSLTVDAPTVGKLAFAAKFSDTSLGGLADPEQATDARAAARLDSVSLRFDDGGFVGKMLAMQADLYGGSKDDVRDALVYGALPLVLNYVKNVAFRQQFMDAASAFLANPKNFTVTANPPMPVPLGEAVRIALHAPLELPDLLSPQVAANK
jgi:hypothetical protein